MTPISEQRILAIASAAGHWVQLQRLRPALDGARLTYVTTDAGYREGLLEAARERGEAVPQFFAIPEANRWQKLRLAAQLITLSLILIRVRPHVVISTGAAPGFFAIMLGKWLGARTIWIDSIANAAELSLSGRLAGRYADLWLTQWPHLAEDEATPHALKFRGAVI